MKECKNPSKITEAAIPSSARRGKMGSMLPHVFLISAIFLTFYPFAFMFITSLKDTDQFIANFWGLSLPLHWENYRIAWEAIGKYVLNSVIVSACSVVGVLIVSSVAGYAFARHKFPGSTFLFYCLLSLMMVPSVLTLISSFMWMKQFPLVGGNNWLGQGGTGFLNTHLALILPYISGGQVFAIFILRSFIAALPEELFEAARIDGASEMQSFWSIVIPLSKPILGTVAIMTLIGTWNDYVWPLLVLQDDSLKTLAIGLASFRGEYVTSYGPLMAGYTLACIPLLVLFLFTMKYFVEGLTAGALKA